MLKNMVKELIALQMETNMSVIGRRAISMVVELTVLPMETST